MSELVLLEKVERWLTNHPGGRVIIRERSVEICARDVHGLPSDPCRYMDHDIGQPSERAAALAELVVDMLHWEVDDWRYEADDGLAFLDRLGSKS